MKGWCFIYNEIIPSNKPIPDKTLFYSHEIIIINIFSIRFPLI